MKKTKIVFFADLHLKGEEIQSQTDLGGPSRIIPERAQKVINSLNPDYVFGLGDATAFSKNEEWINYKKWVEGIKAPVHDVFGNHDRNYCVQEDNSGKEYFSILGRIADTKALKIGNFVFILVSEEYSPAGSTNNFTATVPKKRFEFIEKILKKYSKKNNVFILSHTPVSGTTVLSTKWMCNSPSVWWPVSKKYISLYRKYDVIAHITGHTHIDYRTRLYVLKQGDKWTKEKRGKFFNGKQDPGLPSTHFLNMPCVDIAHGWLTGRVPFLINLDDSYKNWKNPLRELFLKFEDKGPRYYDLMTKAGMHAMLGRSAVYYFEILSEKKEIKLITRWIEKNKDAETYFIKLNHAAKSSKLKFLDSDLSMIDKINVIISKDAWFEILGGENASASFSKRFSKKVKIKRLEINSKNKIDFSVKWKGSKDHGENWSEWVDNPKKLGEVDAVLIDVSFDKIEKKLLVDDVKIIV